MKWFLLSILLAGVLFFTRHADVAIAATPNLSGNMITDIIVSDGGKCIIYETGLQQTATCYK